jgi:hypothetical protein
MFDYLHAILLRNKNFVKNDYNVKIGESIFTKQIMHDHLDIFESCLAASVGRE